MRRYPVLMKVEISDRVLNMLPRRAHVYHYLASVKLLSPKRWDVVKKKLQPNDGIPVNFFQSHEYYYSTYTYYLHGSTHFKSPNHPDLQEIGSPATKKVHTDRNLKKKI